MRRGSNHILSATNGIKKYIPKSVKHVKKVGSAPSPSTKETPDYGENAVINPPKLIGKSRIIFKGKNNILFCEEGLSLIKCHIRFEGNNGVVYLSRNKAARYHVNIMACHDSVVYIGEETRFNVSQSANIHASDHKNIIIGRDCMFSWNPWIFTSDGHPIYDATTKKRLNTGKSVLIGDHVWIGQGVTILKGSRVGSGAVIGSHSTLTGKRYGSNTSYAGIPAREIQKNIFFTKHSINHSDIDSLEHINEYPSDDFIYKNKRSERLTLEEIDDNLLRAKTPEKKLEYVREYLANKQTKNRFYIKSHGN